MKNLKKSSVFKPSPGPFLAILILFAGFSLYTITSYIGSTNDLISYKYASVVSEGSTSDILFDPIKIFTDVNRDHVNALAIETLYNKGIVQGYDDGSFKPDKTINRAELLTILTTAIDADFGGKSYGNCFSDVNDQWFAVFICYAKEGDWVKGFENGSYKPDQPVTKAEALKIVFEAFGFEKCGEVLVQPYGDVSLDAWYAPYACSAKKNSIIPAAGLFNGESKITRGEFTQIIYNVMKKEGLL